MANRRQGVLAFAFQSAEGSPASAPAFAFPFSAGGGPKATRDKADLPVTRPTSARAGQYVQRARGEGTATILAHQDVVGPLALAALGAQTATGTKHVITMAEDLVQFLTVWSLIGDAWWRFPDTLVQSFGIQSASGENVMIVLGLVSWHFEPNVAAPTYLPVFLPDQPRFKHIGSTAKVAPIGRTPEEVTLTENIDLEVRRTLDLRYGTKLTPQKGIPIREVDFSATFTFDPDEVGWDFVDVAATGSLTGAGETQNVGQGSLDVQFGRHLDDGGAHFLRVYSGPPTTGDVAPFSANWEFDAERPDPDPGGGAIEISAAGRLIDPPENPGGSELTLIVVDSHTGLYS